MAEIVLTVQCEPTQALLEGPGFHTNLPGRYKFDDERVTKEELKRALEEQYGGEEEVYYLGY